AEAVAVRRKALAAFEGEWRSVDTTGGRRGDQGDYRLMGSALARGHWELDGTRGGRRNPLFYLGQTVGVLHQDLLRPPPFDSVRTSELVHRLERIPRTLEEARANLTESLAPFTRLAVTSLDGMGPRLERVGKALGPLLEGPDATRLATVLTS